MKLTSNNVNKIFMDCLFREGEDTSKAVMADGVMLKVGFHPERLGKHKAEIMDLLNQLPDAFQSDKGGGWSFLNACDAKDNDQWGEHRNIDQLLTLGIASRQARILMPRELWGVMPGGMPYFQVGAEKEQHDHPTRT